MKRLILTPLSATLLILAGCGDKAAETPAAGTGETVAAVAAPSGTAWSDHVEATELGMRMGNPNAAIKLVEYGSYTCPHCKDFNAEAHDPLIRDYVDTGKISFEYRSLIRDAVDLTAAMVARCGGPEPFFALSTQMFANQDEMIAQLRSHGDGAIQSAYAAGPEQRFIKIAELGNLIEFAKQRGLPEEKVRACLADPQAAQKLTDESNDVLKKYPDFPGTPSFLLNDTLLDNTATWATLEAKLRGAGA